MRRRLVVIVIGILLVSAGVQWFVLSGSASSGAREASSPSGQASQSASPTPTVVYMRPNFQTGVAFPQWGADGYSLTDPNWATGLSEIQQQTAARWVEMVINFSQQTYDSTTVQIGPQTPTPTSVFLGILAAHAAGFHVYIVPVITLTEPGPALSRWAGEIRCTLYSACDAWFASYWDVLRPYAAVAQSAHADEFAVGTEFSHLEFGIDQYWTNLLQEVAAVYHGPLTYDLNFASVHLDSASLPAWWRSPQLTAIGVSAYFSLVDRPARVSPTAMYVLWAQRVKAPLDQLSVALGKPVVISEIGYTDSADALYEPYGIVKGAPPDPQEQAGGYAAALENVVRDQDPHIVGIYFWAWSLPPFAPNGLPAAGVLHQWYTSPLA